MTCDYDPLAALSIRLFPTHGICWINSHADYFIDLLGDDTVDDLREAVGGDEAAAWRAARAIAPTAAIWFDGEDDRNWLTSYWNGASRGIIRSQKVVMRKSAAILSTGISARMAGE